MSLISLIFTLFLSFSSFSEEIDPCDVFGKVFVTDDARYAHFRVFIETSEAFADVLVYKQENTLFADRAGQWSFVRSHSLADVYIYFESNRNMADFSIYYMDVESFAGCNN